MIGPKDNTTGTAEVDDFEDKDPDDCYCEAEGMNKYYLADVSLREADPLDIPLIVKMKIQTILDSEPDHEPTQEELAKITRYVENDIPKHLKDIKKIMYDNDRFIGILISYQKGADWFIDDIYLLPEYRHQGIGRMILEDEVTDHDQIALRVYKNNTHAIELYESLGFKVEGDMGATQLMRLRKNPTDLKELKEKGKISVNESYVPLSEFDHFFQEAKMKAKTRKELDDSDFALVYKDASGNKIRKYPINDEAHVKAAARMFPRGVPYKYRKEVAGKILRRAHKFGIDTSGWKSLNAANEKD